MLLDYQHKYAPMPKQIIPIYKHQIIPIYTKTQHKITKEKNLNVLLQGQ